MDDARQPGGRVGGGGAPPPLGMPSAIALAHELRRRILGWALVYRGPISAIELSRADALAHELSNVSFHIRKLEETTDPHLGAPFLHAVRILPKRGSSQTFFRCPFGDHPTLRAILADEIAWCEERRWRHDPGDAAMLRASEDPEGGWEDGPVVGFRGAEGWVPALVENAARRQLVRILVGAGRPVSADSLATELELPRRTVGSHLKRLSRSTPGGGPPLVARSDEGRYVCRQGANEALLQLLGGEGGERDDLDRIELTWTTPPTPSR